MSLMPTKSLAKLYALRGRERMIHVAWGLTRWLALALTLFTAAAFVDWGVDHYVDTPLWVRAPLMLIQLVVLSVAGLFWIVFPLTRGPSLIRLARRVEKRIPEFDHRLITSIQLTRGDAQVAGMSPQLIRMVTAEAEGISDKHDLVTLADTRRLKWSAALAAWPLGILCFLLLFFGPTLLGVLLLRQFLANVDIPRDVHLTTTTKKNPWPAGDEVTVTYEVTSKKGNLSKEMTGTVLYFSAESHGECELVWDDRTEFAADHATFKARVPHSSTPFSYRARIGDGRSTTADKVEFEPRPQITIERIWVQAPAFVPGRPVAEQTTKNIVRAYDGSRARVRVTVQKPIAEAKLVLYKLDEKGIMVEADSLPMKILDGNAEAQSYPAESDYFDLSMAPGVAKLVGYSVAVRDLNRFDSVDNPRGMIDIIHPKTPFVKILPERYYGTDTPRGTPFTQEQALEGMPVKLGGQFMVEYKFRSEIGACKPYRRKSDNQMIEPAWLIYRVNDGPWERLKLNEVPETPETGPYDADNASFANLQYQKEKLHDEVPFHAKPAPPNEPGAAPRVEGGGFFEVFTAKLRKMGTDGMPAPLEVNDRIGYYIAIFDCDPAADRQPGVSDYREKTVKTEEEVFRQGVEAQREMLRIQEIAKRQKENYARPKSGP
jgi:hypothetical protein